MINRNRLGRISLLLGDMIILYISLFLSLVIRDFSLPSSALWQAHLFPFLLINAFWIFAFYVAGFYDKGENASSKLGNILNAIVVGVFIAIFFFYAFPSFGIAPKTVLIIDAIVASVLIWIRRNSLLQKSIRSAKTKIFFFGKENAQEISDFISFLKNNPQFGYVETDDINNADIVITIPEEIKNNADSVNFLYETALAGKTVLAFDKFYESLTGKIPVSLISATWFLENLKEPNDKTMERFRRGLDIILAVICSIPFIIILPFAALLIKLSSPGPTIFKQKRVGKNGKVFEVFKFRSMVQDAEKEKTGWIKPEGKEKRITFAGNILRKTRIDELPQLINVFRGEMSFIGPRPERPEFVQELIKQIPYYSMRHLVKPGLTGWAQINFSDASAKDAPEKLQYDLYYIKNQSILLDAVIILKTIAVLLSRSGK